MSLGFLQKNMSKVWKITLLVNLVTPKQWKTLPIKNLHKDGYIVYGANGKIGFYNQYTHKDPTLMVTCRGASCGNISISEPYSYINGNAMALDQMPKKNIDLNYIKYCLMARKLDDVITGSAQPQITRQSLHNVELIIASIFEQKEIADRLDTLLAQVEKSKAHLERVPQIMKKFRQSVLKDAVSGKLTQDWRKKEHAHSWINTQLKEHVNYLKYGSSSKSYKIGTVPVLRMGNIQNGRLDWSNLMYSSDQLEIQKYELKKDDLLFNRTNSPELVGKTAIYKGEQKAIYAGYLIAIRCSSNLIPDYLNYHLNSPQAKIYCKKVKSDGVSQSNINAKKLSDYPIFLPSVEEQLEIVKQIEKLFNYADQIEQQAQNALNKVNQLTQSILAKAFRGELTKTWRAENPELITGENSAEALLEKIKLEREAVKTQPKKRKKIIKSSDTHHNQVIKSTSASREQKHMTIMAFLKSSKGKKSAQDIFEHIYQKSTSSKEDVTDFYSELKSLLEANKIKRERIDKEDLFSI